MSLLDEVSGSTVVTRKCNIFSDQPNTYYDEENEIIYNTEVLSLVFVIAMMLTSL